MRRRSRPSASLAAGGFTLLELLAAVTIFGLMASLVLVNKVRAADQALASVRARELRVLAERRLGKVLTFEREYDDLFDGQNFDDFERDRWDDWEWELDITDVVVFGTSNDENAVYLFGTPEEDAEDEDESQPGAGGERRGETQFLRQLTLIVRAPSIEGEESDSVKLVTFVPLVDHTAGDVPPPGGN